MQDPLNIRLLKNDLGDAHTSISLALITLQRIRNPSPDVVNGMATLELEEALEKINKTISLVQKF